MGKKKIKIDAIEDQKLRYITFNKRKGGLLRKAAEMSMLCKIPIHVSFVDVYGNLITFDAPSRSETESKIEVEQNFRKIYDFNLSHYPNFFKIKKKNDLKSESEKSIKVELSAISDEIIKNPRPNNFPIEEVPLKKIKLPNLKVEIPENGNISQQISNLKLNIPQNKNLHLNSKGNEHIGINPKLKSSSSNTPPDFSKGSFFNMNSYNGDKILHATYPSADQIFSYFTFSGENSSFKPVSSKGIPELSK